METHRLIRKPLVKLVSHFHIIRYINLKSWTWLENLPLQDWQPRRATTPGAELEDSQAPVPQQPQELFPANEDSQCSRSSSVEEFQKELESELEAQLANLETPLPPPDIPVILAEKPMATPQPAATEIPSADEVPTNGIKDSMGLKQKIRCVTSCV